MGCVHSSASQNAAAQNHCQEDFQEGFRARKREAVSDARRQVGCVHSSASQNAAAQNHLLVIPHVTGQVRGGCRLRVLQPMEPRRWLLPGRGRRGEGGIRWRDVRPACGRRGITRS